MNENIVRYTRVSKPGTTKIPKGVFFDVSASAGTGFLMALAEAVRCRAELVAEDVTRLSRDREVCEKMLAVAQAAGVTVRFGSVIS